MEQITSSKKYQNGIQVFWTREETTVNEFFSYDDLVEQRINALDLLNNPRLYLMNSPGHQIESAAPGCSFSTKTCEDEILITRLFDAPRDLVWKVWTEPDLVMQWWGPKNFTSPTCTSDFRVGGTYLYCMRSPQGRDFWDTGVFREIIQNEKIVCTDNFADEKGNVVPPSYYGMGPDTITELVMTVTFEVLAGRTQLTLRYLGISGGEMTDLTRAGWNESLDKYAGVLGQAVYKKKGEKEGMA